jgi:hypothetical protein
MFNKLEKIKENLNSLSETTENWMEKEHSNEIINCIEILNYLQKFLISENNLNIIEMDLENIK